MGLLEFSRAVRNLPTDYKTDLNADEILAEAELYFDKLRAWMDDPTIIGGQAADRHSSKLGPVSLFLNPSKFRTENSQNRQKAM